MTTKGDSLAKLLVRRVGMFKAAKVLSFLVMYGTLWLEAEGRRVTMEELAEVWAYSPATVYRHLRLFREAIPEFDHPADLCEWVMEHREDPIYSRGLVEMWGVA